MEILAVLYLSVMRYDPKNPLDPNRDRLLIGKAHCVLAHIPVLAEAGYISHPEIFEFLKDGGRLTGHPRNPQIGFEYSGGSLGMALSVAIGIAWKAREQKRDTRVYVLMGDGELHEGSVWEAFMAAAHYGLGRLTVIIDRNHLSIDGDTEQVMGLESLKDKLESFRWLVTVCNGHDIQQLLDAFAAEETSRPHVIIAETVKGKGVSFMEHQPQWHWHRLSRTHYEIARKELQEEGMECG